MSLRLTSLLITALAGLFALAGCQAVDETYPDSAFPEAKVRIENYAFVPADLTIKKGEAVVWQNYDEDITYQIQSGFPERLDDYFTSPNLHYTSYFEHTFTEAGTYPYFCTYHPSYMRGTITVTE